ncbi:DNA-processing protein DprA [soil metagenome]
MAPLDREELAAWLQLLDMPSLGREAVRKLLAVFGSPQGVLDASPSALRDVGNPALLKVFEGPRPDVSALLDTTLAWLNDVDSGTPARTVIVIGDPRYPQLLLESADPPLLIYAQGRVEMLQREAVAIVGSRNATPQGLENARAFAAHLSAAGVTIVSGLALGIDGAAHEGALEASGAKAGSTISVVGTGLDRVYPKRHLDLARRIARAGLIISEYPLGTPPLPPYFPQRNRIIAGLSRGTLVVEAAQSSGSMITARMAMESSREVFAIPGSIHSAQSRGCNSLIKQGAKLVDRAQDILEELQLQDVGPASRTAESPVSSTSSRNSLSAAPSNPQQDLLQGTPAATAIGKDPLLDAIGYEPISLDELVARTGWPAHELSGRLLDLELQGVVTRMPGQLFQRLVIA